MVGRTFGGDDIAILRPEDWKTPEEFGSHSHLGDSLRPFEAERLAPASMGVVARQILRTHRG
jgi:hypothetical protein